MRHTPPVKPVNGKRHKKQWNLNSITQVLGVICRGLYNLL